MLIDVLMVLIVAAFAAYGYRRGLMRSFAGVVSYLLSAVFAAAFLPAVSGYLKKTAMTQKIAAAVNEKYVSGSLAAADGGGLIAKYINKAAEGAADIISNNIAELIVSVIAFVAVLILARLVIMLLGRVFGVFLHLPIIKQANGLGGAALGGLLGVDLAADGGIRRSRRLRRLCRSETVILQRRLKNRHSRRECMRIMHFLI